MVNDNIITKTMYHKVRGIIRGEITHLSCPDCVNIEDNCDCDCNMMFSPFAFKPREEYLDRVAKKICESIGEPLDYDTYEEEEKME